MYTLKISTPFFEHISVNEFEEVSYDAAEEYIRDFLCGEIFNSLISMYQIEPAGYFSHVNEVGESLYNFFESTIKSAERIVAIFEEIDSDDKVSTKHELCLKELFLEMVEQSTGDESYFVYTGAVVEDSLYRFITSSTWHWGLQSVADSSVIEGSSVWSASIKSDEQMRFSIHGNEMIPILWYGPEGASPIPCWTISPVDTDEKIKFWFEWESHEVMENLQDDPDQMFLVWYIYECGRWYPDLDDILLECPIQIMEGDSIAQISKKLYSYVGSKVSNKDSGPN